MIEMSSNQYVEISLWYSIYLICSVVEITEIYGQHLKIKPGRVL